MALSTIVSNIARRFDTNFQKIVRPRIDAKNIYWIFIELVPIEIERNNKPLNENNVNEQQ